MSERLGEIGSADILVGIPSYNNASTIGHVVRAVQAGIAKYFPDRKAVLVNSDGGSKDGTMRVVEEAMIEDFRPLLITHRKDTLFKIVTPYHGVPGKGSAFRTVFEIAKALDAKACAVVDSDLRSITPEWIDLLIGPVLSNDYDFVSPYYLRHKYDGTITNSIVYPLTRALYGKRIRQPIGGDFGFSGRLASFYLKHDVWETDIARFGIDIWMTTTAVANDFKVCQSFLGAKIHDPKEPSSDLSSMLHQVVNSVFELMETYSGVWRNVGGSSPVPIFGFQYGVGLEPVNVNLSRMIEVFKLGAGELKGVWKDILSAEAMDSVLSACSLKEEEFRLEDGTWATAIYDFALASHRKVMNREHMLKSLTPLYLAKVASFVNELRSSTAREVEDRLERLCASFEEAKPYLVEKWR